MARYGKTGERLSKALPAQIFVAVVVATTAVASLSSSLGDSHGNFGCGRALLEPLAFRRRRVPGHRAAGMASHGHGTSVPRTRHVAAASTMHVVQQAPLKVAAMRLLGLQTYGLLSSLVLSAAMSMLLRFELEDRGADAKSSPLEIFTYVCLTACVLSGLYSTTCMSLTVAYSYTALGLEKGDLFQAFFMQTAGIRLRAFRGYVACLLTFCMGFCGTAFRKVYRTKARSFVAPVLVCGVIVIILDLSRLMQAASRCIFDPSVAQLLQI